LLFFENQSYPSSRRYLDKFLTRHPQHTEALVTRARLLVRMKEYPGAVRDYADAIRYSSDPIPEFFIERSQAISAQSPAHIDEAIQALDEGIDRLGPIVTLQLPAIDLELTRKNYGAALTRLETLSAPSERKEGWLFQKGEI